MKIATRLKINALLAAAMVVVASLAFALAFLMQRDARERAATADKLMRGTFELNNFSNAYLRHPEERPREQWMLRYNSLVNSLEGIPFQKRGQHVLVERIKQNLNDMKTLFDTLVATYASSRPAATEVREQLADLMIERSREISLDAARLSAASDEEIEAINRNIAVVLPLITIVLTIITLWLSMRIGRSIGDPIRKLLAGAEMIGSGNLDYCVGNVSDDELGQLSSAFDNMVGKLKEITVSRNDLVKEIAERKRTEEERNHALRVAEERTAELEMAIRELEGFTYSVSHDLRAPIRHMASYSQLLKEASWPVLSEESRTFLATIMEASKRLGILIDELLEFSRAGRKEMLKKPVNLDRLIQEIIRSFAGETVTRTIEWSVASLPEVYGDPAMLHLVLFNLLSNAVKFTQSRSTARIEIGSAETEEEHIIHVKDNGIGFDMEYYNKLFGVFQRLHTAEEFEGTGIGLANVQRIIHRHGGRVWAGGKVDEGAAFYLTLPKEKKDGPR